MESDNSILNKFLLPAFFFLLLICPNQSTRTTPCDPLEIAADELSSTHGHRKLGRAMVPLSSPQANVDPNHPSHTLP